MKAINLKNVKWETKTGIATFEATRPGFGIQDDAGRVMFGKDGAPAVWSTKKIVEQMLPYADGFKGYTWECVL